MNISNLGSFNPYRGMLTKVNHPVVGARNDLLKKLFEKKHIDEGQLTENTVRYDDEYVNYLDKLSDRKPIDTSLPFEKWYKNSLKEYNEIENSEDNETTKEIKRSALEHALKTIVEFSVHVASSHTYIIDVSNQEKDAKIAREMSLFRFNQTNAIMGGAKRLTLNFLEYAKQNNGLDYDAMFRYINKDSKNERDINNLSLTELTGFFEYAQNSGYTHTQSYSDTAFYKDYFHTVADSRYGEALSEEWKGTIFNAYA